MDRHYKSRWSMSLRDMWEYVRDYVLGILVIVGLVGLICGFFAWARFAREADVATAKPQHGMATVSSLDAPLASKSGSTRPVVWLDFGGKPYRFMPLTIEDYAKMTVGQKVSITFRRGKSGSVYVEKVEPIQPANPFARVGDDR